MTRNARDDRHTDDLRRPTRGYGGDPRRMEQMRYTGQAGWGIGHGYPDEVRDREDGSGPYRHGGTPGEGRWRSGYGGARGSGVDDAALSGPYGQGRGGPARTGAPVWPKGYTRSDQRIHEELCERLAGAHHVDVREVEVNVNEGWVTLTGTVPHRQQKYRIEDIAATVAGVKDVENGIRVVPGTGDTSWTDQSSEPGLTGQPGQAEQPGQPGQPAQSPDAQTPGQKPDDKPV